MNDPTFAGEPGVQAAREAVELGRPRRVVYSVDEIYTMRHWPLEMRARTSLVHRVCGAFAVLFCHVYPVRLKKPYTET